MFMLAYKSVSKCKLEKLCKKKLKWKKKWKNKENWTIMEKTNKRILS